MGRFSQSQEEEAEQGIDISPLIDCVFILLIFFIVTTVFVEETGVEIDKPQAATASDLEKNSVFIALTAAGEVIHNEKNIGVGGVMSLVKRNIQEDKDTPVIIQADDNSRSGLLVQVIGQAKLAGAIKVSVAASPQG